MTSQEIDVVYYTGHGRRLLGTATIDEGSADLIIRVKIRTGDPSLMRAKDVMATLAQVPTELVFQQKELYLTAQRIEVRICGNCEGKVIAARGTAPEPLAVCPHLDESVISLPDTIHIVSANTGEVIFTFEVPVRTAEEKFSEHRDRHPAAG